MAETGSWKDFVSQCFVDAHLAENLQDKDILLPVVDYIQNLKTPEAIALYLEDFLGHQMRSSECRVLAKKIYLAKTAVGSEPINCLRKNNTKSEVAKPLNNRRIKANGRLPKKHSKKQSKPGSIINCLMCGKIERNGARTCTFCKEELVYWGESDDEENDPEKMCSLKHKEKLLGYDAEGSSKESKVLILEDDDMILEVDDDDTQPMRITMDFDRKVVLEQAQSIPENLPEESVQMINALKKTLLGS